MTEGLFPAGLGFAATIVCLLSLGKGSFLVAAMAAMLVCFFLRYHLTEGGQKA